MTTINARTVAIIGAGPSGIIAAKYLRAEKAFDKIVLFEQRSRLGGIWNHTPEDREEDLFSVPQTDPRGKNQDPIWRERSQSSHSQEGKDNQIGVTREASFLSPVYDRLETNIPRGLMGFQDLDWPAESQLFPTHQTVLQYIETYGQDVKPLVRFETQVTNVAPVDNTEATGKWHVRTRNLRSNEEQDHTYDAVIVANGHFIVPYIPDIPGIRDWNKRYKGAITHSKYFRTPEAYTGKKVIVVGNSASGLDISAQIAQHSAHPLLWSSKSVSMFAAASPSKTPDPLRRELPPIATFLPQTRGVAFEDGTEEHDIDAVVFATGYFYSLPFLSGLKPAVISDGTHVQHTYQHLFYAPRPTLSFLALNQRVIPFPLAEAQSAVVARVYAGRLPLPPQSEMQDWEETAERENGSGKTFHVLPFPKDAEYINEMSRWAMSARRREGLENDGRGKTPPVWGGVGVLVSREFLGYTGGVWGAGGGEAWY